MLRVCFSLYQMDKARPVPLSTRVSPAVVISSVFCHLDTSRTSVPLLPFHVRPQLLVLTILLRLIFSTPLSHRLRSLSEISPSIVGVDITTTRSGIAAFWTYIILDITPNLLTSYFVHEPRPDPRKPSTISPVALAAGPTIAGIPRPRCPPNCCGICRPRTALVLWSPFPSYRSSIPRPRRG